MSTIYDLVTVLMFAGLVVLFLQRSTAPEGPQDHMYQYVPPCGGCAIANYLGNNHEDAFAVATIIAVLIYVVIVLKPFSRAP